MTARVDHQLAPLIVWVLCALSVVLPSTANAAHDDLTLVTAAKDQDWATVARLVHGDEGTQNQRPDINAPQRDGATALHWAAHWDHLATIDALVDAGANVDAQNEYGATALWVACANRRTDAVRRMLEAGANANIGLRSGETLLMRCAYTGDALAVEALLEYGAEVDATEPSNGQTALMWAAANRQAGVARVLVEHGAAVDTRTRVVSQLRGTGLRSTTSPEGASMFKAGGFTPLLFATRHGDIDSATVLLDAGVDVNTRAADGNSALTLAAMSGHGHLAEFLLERGADPNAADAGYTALHAAVLRSDPDVVKTLLTHGANPNVRLTRGTPVPRWTYQLVLTLREKGATPFALAAKYLEPEIMRLLIAAGADPYLPFDDGTTPLMAAVGVGLSHSTNRRSQLIAPELVAAEWRDEPRVLETVSVVAAVGAATGAAIDQPGRRGNTSLHTAARNGFETVVELLVAQGGSLDIENENGETPAGLLTALATDTDAD
jgi:ankyrin repeat protein